MTSAVGTLATQLGLLAARKSGDGAPKVSQMAMLTAYGPPETKLTRVSQLSLLVDRAASAHRVTTKVSQGALLAAYGTGVPGLLRNAAWTFVMDGHRFYVLPLGPEGDWAYDTTTHEWSQLSTTGYPGLNFTHGVMWGLRVIGGDVQYSYLYELDPTQPNDQAWREILRMVTGGVATRSRASIGVANFTLTASVGDDASISQPISLAYSDDNGVTWSQEFDLMLTDVGTQTLMWPALGSYSAPGRVFRVTDTGGPIRIDGADAVLTIGTGVDASQDQDKG